MTKLRMAGLALGGWLAVSAVAEAKTCPNIMFVLDSSSSMAEDPNGVLGNHPTKFELLQQAVISVINQYGDRVPFGLEVFSASGLNPGSPTADALCYSQTMISVEPPPPTQDRSLSANMIITDVKAAGPVANSNTNTGEAIERAAMDMALADTQRPNYIVLITDGVPSCNSIDRMNLALENEATFTVGQINNARNQMPSIKTFVVGFDGGDAGVDKSTLDDMAFAGGEAPMNCGNGTPCYLSASDAVAFQMALANVIDQIAGGEFGDIYCDDSCFASGCPSGQKCVKGELDPTPVCQPDPCQGKTCTGIQYCREGQCVNACATPCKNGQTCQSGTCVNDPCASVTCEVGSVCCPLGVTGCATGTCVIDFCAGTPASDGMPAMPGKMCTPPTTCEQGTGKCVLDECGIITCPANTTCLPGGNCTASTGGAHGPGGSCTVGSGSEGIVSSMVLCILALFGLALTLRRSARA